MNCKVLSRYSCQTQVASALCDQLLVHQCGRTDGWGLEVDSLEYLIQTFMQKLEKRGPS